MFFYLAPNLAIGLASASTRQPLVTALWNPGDQVDPSMYSLLRNARVQHIFSSGGAARGRWTHRQALSLSPLPALHLLCLALPWDTQKSLGVNLPVLGWWPWSLLKNRGLCHVRAAPIASSAVRLGAHSASHSTFSRAPSTSSCLLSYPHL